MTTCERCNGTGQRRKLVESAHRKYGEIMYFNLRCRDCAGLGKVDEERTVEP
jgi:DnaJ-class molecular chaperone